MLTTYADAVALAVGLALPAIVAVFTRPSTNSTVKGLAHAVLATATGSLTVYKTDPAHFVWAPAVIAAFLAWLSGTALYHSLLKKYSWFGALQNLFAPKVESRLNTYAGSTQYFEVAQAAERAQDEQGITNNFPLSTDIVQSGVREAVQAAEKIPTVGALISHVEPVVVPAVVAALETAVAPAVGNTTLAATVQTGGLGPRAL